MRAHMQQSLVEYDPDALRREIDDAEAALEDALLATPLGAAYTRYLTAVGREFHRRMAADSDRRFLSGQRTMAATESSPTSLRIYSEDVSAARSPTSLSGSPTAP